MFWIRALNTVLITTALAWAAAVPPPIEVEATKPFAPQGKPLKGLVITLDAGHGGSAHQPGYSGSARGINSRLVEGDLNMLVAAQLRHHLVDAGATVHMTRWDDRRVASASRPARANELGERVQKALDTQSHLLVSLHHNSAPRRTADGVVVLTWPTDSSGADQPLERALYEALRDEVTKKVHSTEKHKPRIEKHPVVAASNIPSAVIEFGFLTNPEFDAWVNRRGSHRDEAIGAYNGIVRMWTEHRDALERLRARNFPGAGPVPAMLADAGETTGGVSRQIAALAKRLWPHPQPPAGEEEAVRLLAAYKGQLTDSTFFYLDAEVEKTTASWVLTGRTNHEFLRAAAGGLLEAAGCTPLENRVEQLPSARLGDLKYGVVQIPMAMTWGKPAEGDNVQTQLLLGERVFLLDETDDREYLLLHGGDGYIGWVRSEAVRRMSAAEFSKWGARESATLTRDTMVDTFRLPTGAELPILSGDASTTNLVVELPQVTRTAAPSSQVSVARNVLRVRDDATSTPGELAAAAAVEFLTVPYVFGGKSRLGLDCSGLTSGAYAAVGLTLPRDARQQVLVGKMVATPWHLTDLHPGDLLFFCGEQGNVMHTAVSLGGMRYIHASPPEVQVNSFDPADPLYSALWHKHFAFARRPLR
jgi:gamma-D-glutamyl-L-lysine dipeptidyl-peptidase